MNVQETQAQAAAEAILIRLYPEEYDRLLRSGMLARGEDAPILVSRTVQRWVTETEAEVLAKFGWIRVPSLTQEP